MQASALSIRFLDAECQHSFLFVSRLFITQKYPYSALNQLLEHHLPLTGEQWPKLQPLISPPESSASRGHPLIDEYLFLDE
jgi:hypothetical protein